ncbi:MAG: dehydrogenase [Prevotella sp.]|nr:dehydrogenase [Prevotella sp.]
MADNYLERHREDYEVRKAAWLRRKNHLPKTAVRKIERPDDEAL